MENIEHILLTAKEEIKALRKENEILGAKVNTMEGMFQLLHATSRGTSRGFAEDIVIEIEKYFQDRAKK